ncbi:unnamed protein product [Meloidogyne enterolobii]|uniref:Uncharacterized protein n=1 Tax=Meloidogyne enterolobii TaxID=390850 RepID=A0ACB1AQ86_MELEN
MLLRNLIFIFWLKFASCGHGSAGYANYGYWDANGYWVEGRVPNEQGHPNNVDGNTDWNQGYTQHHDTFHHLVGHKHNLSQDYAPSNFYGNTDWNQDGSNVNHDFDGVAQQFGTLHLHGDPSNVVYAGGYGDNIPIQTYGHTKTGGRDQKHSGDASSSRSRGKRIKQDNSPHEGLGHEGEGDEEVQEEERQHMPLSIDPNESKQYRVEIYLKRFDGGTVLLLEPWKGRDKYSTIDIEKVLSILRIANVEYRPVEDIENHKKDPELYGDVSFIEGSGKLRAAEGETISTKVLADRIADWSNRGGNISKWMVRGKNYQNEIFEPMFDGHIMVVLHDIGEEGKERFRIHFTMDRLNLFDSVNRKNYFVIIVNKELVIIPDENVWNRGDTLRGTRWREDKFCPQKRRKMEVSTRPLTLYQILNIAYYKVIDGRTSDDKPIPFKCRHFSYEFITAIAADKFQPRLLVYENWPENITFMDNQVTAKERITKPQYPTAFEHSFDKLTELAKFNDYDNNKYTQAIPIIPPNH